jgi:hypothetical protein
MNSARQTTLPVLAGMSLPRPHVVPDRRVQLPAVSGLDIEGIGPPPVTEADSALDIVIFK